MVIKQVTRQVVDDIYDELEALVCNCMAAGVSADMFIVTHSLSSTVIEDDSKTFFKASSQISFKPLDSA